MYSLEGKDFAIKYLKNLFQEYKDPSYIDFQLCDEPLNAIHPNEITEKYITSSEQIYDKDYIFEIAKNDPRILAIVSEEIKNDRIFILKLYKKKHPAAAFIGRDLRKDSNFLLELNKISPVCWRYILEKHYLPATFEQKLYQWCLYQLNLYEYVGTKFRLKRCSTMGCSAQLGLLSALEKINIMSEKQDIINFIERCKCSIVDSYYDFHVVDDNIAKAIIDHDYKLLYKVEEKDDILKNYNCFYYMWQKIKFKKSIHCIALKPIKNFSNDVKLAELVLGQRHCQFAYKYFSEDIQKIFQKQIYMNKKCDCGQVLWPEWKLCPICGRNVEQDSHA